MSVWIIAEAGVNHNGDLGMARQMVDVAAESGADAVKFQTYIPEKVISVFAKKADYQVTSTGGEESQLDMVRKLWLSFDSFRELDAYCRQRNIVFLSTPFDIPSLRFLDTLDIPAIKIPSGEITNLPLLLEAAATGRKVILSTGMSELDEIDTARQILLGGGCPSVALLHCNTEYPTPYEDANLRAMLSIRRRFGGVVGYSDHTMGIEAPIAAVALGAEIIEKHFTLDRTLPGPDQFCSAQPDELAQMVTSIRNIEKALGTGEKKPSPSERKNMAIARKSIVAAQDIEAGELLTADNLDIKRPGDGISPMRWNEVVGQRAMRNYVADEQIEL